MLRWPSKAVKTRAAIVLPELANPVGGHAHWVFQKWGSSNTSKLAELTTWVLS